MSTQVVPFKQHHEIQDVVLLDDQNPRSVLKLLPKAFAQKVRDVMSSHPDHFNLEEGELFQRLRERNTKPSGTDDILRLKFWIEYERVQSFQLDQMNLSYVCSGVCEFKYFTDFWMRSPHRVAWLVCPPINYSARLDEMMNEGLRAMSEIMREPIHHPTSGKPDYKMMDMKLKIFNLVAAKKEAMEMPVRQLDDKQSSNQNVQVNIGLNLEKDSAKVASAIQGNNVEAMEKRLNDLRLMEARISHTVVQPSAYVPATPELVEAARTYFTSTKKELEPAWQPEVDAFVESVKNSPLVESDPESGVTGYEDEDV